MTYQESHFPSNQADFRLLLGMVAFSPSSPLPKALSCLPCDVCPIFCHSGVICEQGEPIRGSSAVCHSQCWFILRMLPWAQHWGLIVAAALCGCHWLKECRAREELCPFRAHTLTAVPCRSTHTNSQPCPSWRSALFSTPLQLCYLPHFSPMCLKRHETGMESPLSACPNTPWWSTEMWKHFAYPCMHSNSKKCFFPWI